jgi:ethanolamine utilization cobalamin adenosyltransferase
MPWRSANSEKITVLRAEVLRLKGELLEEKRQHIKDLNSVLRMVLLISRGEKDKNGEGEW